MDIISTIKHFFHEFITFNYSLSYLWIINVTKRIFFLKSYGYLSFYSFTLLLVGFNKSSQRISFLSLVKNCNHKGLGIYYLLSAFIFGISGTLISVLIRIELYSSGNRIISPENQNFYNISITLHGFLTAFLHLLHFHFLL